MAREYSNRRSRSRGSVPSQFLVITITFLLGYVTASLLDLQKINQWVNNQVLAYEGKKEVKHEARQAVIPPKPKFEFYTLLANEKVPNSQHATQFASNVATELKKTKASAERIVAPVVVTEPVKLNSTRVQKSNIASRKPEASASVTASTSTGKVNYLVQVASFKARHDAEQMKGRLILKGFDVYIIPVIHATKGNWFRVVVGPYGNRVLAQQAQVNLAKNERLNGMITLGG